LSFGGARGEVVRAKLALRWVGKKRSKTIP